MDVPNFPQLPRPQLPRLKENGLLALGRGTDPDIITASTKAYINGLNRLEYLKANPIETSEVI